MKISNREQEIKTSITTIETKESTLFIKQDNLDYDDEWYEVDYEEIDYQLSALYERKYNLTEELADYYS